MGCCVDKPNRDKKPNQKELPKQYTENETLKKHFSSKQTDSSNFVSPNQIDIQQSITKNNSNFNQEASIFQSNIQKKQQENILLINQFKQQIQDINKEYQQNLKQYPLKAKKEIQLFQTNEEQKSSLLNIQKIIAKEYQQQNSCLQNLEILQNKMQNITVQPLQYKEEELTYLQQLPEFSEKNEIIKKVSAQAHDIKTLFQEYNKLFTNINNKQKEDKEEIDKQQQFLNEIAQKIIKVDEAIKQQDKKALEEKTKEAEKQKQIQEQKDREKKEEDNQLAKQLQEIGKLYAKKFNDIEAQMQIFERKMDIVDKNMESILQPQT